MKLLLTGAGGQLGRDVSSALSGEDEVHALDHARLDVTDRIRVLEVVAGLEPDWIVNCAAFTDVDRAESEEAAARAVNSLAPGHLAEAAGRVGAAILHISTDYVFDGRKGSAYDEEDAPNPLSVYGRTKLEGEERVLASGARACVIRTAWLYGLHGSNFVRSIQAAARRGGPLRVVADQVGSPTFSEDLAGAIARLVRNPAFGLFHLVNQGQVSRYEQARAIAGDSVEVLPITSAQAARPAPRPVNSALRSLRWESAGFPPLRPWGEALRDFLSRSD
jgi:dTDP-4-dehydrorhamnose reductase